jgi:hypothetical protein
MRIDGTKTGYIWDHYALTHLYALDEKQAMAKKFFEDRFFREISLRHS